MFSSPYLKSLVESASHSDDVFRWIYYGHKRLYGAVITEIFSFLQACEFLGENSPFGNFRLYKVQPLELL